jgi:DNA-binding NarL/FixJ family response regulator
VFKALVVEDNPNFRRFLISELEEMASCEVVGQAVDGIAAIQKAEDLQPDLILLDLGLPKLNGMEVVRLARKLSIHSKILIISQDSSPEIVKAALSQGAHGYLLKSDADELQDAIKVVLQGGRFVSCSRKTDPSAPELALLDSKRDKVAIPKNMAVFTTLIAEDYEKFRQQLRHTLLEDSQYVVIGEALDGLQAVQQAEEFQPDLVLLDLSLPKLDGMQTGRRIRRLSPNSKIVFLSQESSPEIVQEALRVGALGYVLKSDANELPDALETVMKGMQFVSSGLCP